jgi:uncharacterized protein (DUF736 family)
MAQYPNSGAIFRNRDKTNDKAPDWRGDVELDTDLLKALIAVAKSRQPIKLSIAGWEKEGNKAGTFVSLKVEIPRAKAAPEAKGGGFGGSADDDEIPF